MVMVDSSCHSGSEVLYGLLFIAVTERSDQLTQSRVLILHKTLIHLVSLRERERERENVITYNNVRRLGDGDRGWRWNEEGEWKMGNGMERGGMGNGELKGEVS